MTEPKVTIRVNDDAPADLALGTAGGVKHLAAGETYDIERLHLPVLAGYVTEVEADAPVTKAEKSAAAKKGKR